jgi:hypothetical protein
MRMTPFAIILFFVSLNVSVYFLNTTAFLGDMGMQPYTAPAGMLERLIAFEEGALVSFGATITVSIIIGYLVSGSLFHAGVAALFLAALNLFVPLAGWVLTGFPLFLIQLGVPAVVTTALEVLFAVVWVWFILGFIAQRSLER